MINDHPRKQSESHTASLEMHLGYAFGMLGCDWVTLGFSLWAAPTTEFDFKDVRPQNMKIDTFKYYFARNSPNLIPAYTNRSNFGLNQGKFP